MAVGLPVIRCTSTDCGRAPPHCEYLWDRCCVNDPVAWAVWCSRFGPMIRGIVNEELHDWPQEREDALQEVLLHLIRFNPRWPRHREDRPPYCAWLLLSARRAAIDFRSRLHRRVRGPVREGDDVPKPDGELTAEEIRCIEARMATFSTEYRLAWYLTYDDGFQSDDVLKIIVTHRAVCCQIADLLEDASTIRHWLCQMRTAFRKCLGSGAT